MSIHEVFPYLCVRSAQEAVSFYAKAFGATEKFRLVEPGGRIGHVELLFGTATIMISEEFPELGFRALDPDRPTSFVLHLHVDDADAMITAAVDAGARIVREAQDQFYGERSGTICDPFGYNWLIGHSIENVEPEEMQRRYDKTQASG